MKERKTLGQNLSQILKEISDTIWEFDFREVGPPMYQDEAVEAACKIFMSVMTDKMWSLQKYENVPMDIRGDMAHKLGSELRRLVKTYTNIDTHDLYK